MTESDAKPEDQRAEPYAQVAEQGRRLVRQIGERPEFDRWLVESVRRLAIDSGRVRFDVSDWLALVKVAFAAIPDDVPWESLTAWRWRGPDLRPHGTRAAVRRHEYHGQPLCEPCKGYEAKRKRDAYHRGRGTEPQPDPWLVDEVAVARACEGERLTLTRQERRAAVARLTAKGMSQNKIGDLLHMDERTVARYQARPAA